MNLTWLGLKSRCCRWQLMRLFTSYRSQTIRQVKWQKTWFDWSCHKDRRHGWNRSISSADSEEVFEVSSLGAQVATRCKKSLVKTVDHRNLQAVPIILVDRQVVTFASTSFSKASWCTMPGRTHCSFIGLYCQSASQRCCPGGVCRTSAERRNL